VAGVASQPKKSVLQPAALQVAIERLPNIGGQLLAGSGQMFNKGRVMALDDLVEQRLLRTMALVPNTFHLQTACCRLLRGKQQDGEEWAGCQSDDFVIFSYFLSVFLRP